VTYCAVLSAAACYGQSPSCRVVDVGPAAGRAGEGADVR
jgi:hypothetical protein